MNLNTIASEKDVTSVTLVIIVVIKAIIDQSPSRAM